MEKLATTDAHNNSNQKVLYLQQAITNCTKLKQILSNSNAAAAPPANSSNSPSSASSASSSSSSPSLSEVTSTLNRLRTTLVNFQSSLNSPFTFLNALKSGESATPAADIRSLMQIIVANGLARKEAYDAGLLNVLLQIILDTATNASAHPNTVGSLRTRSAAVRALRHILGTDISASAAAALDLTPLRAVVPALIALVK